MKTHKAPPSRFASPHHDFRGNSFAHSAVLNVGAIFARICRANCETTMAASVPQLGERGVVDEHADVEVFAGDNLQTTNGCMRARCYVPRRLAPDLEQRTFVTPAGAL
jgi:hypothetical protein